MKKYILILLLPFAFTAAHATTIYKSEDASGHVYFSDQPSEGSEKIIVQPAPTFSTPPLSESQVSAQDDTPAEKSNVVKNYTLAITAPTNDQVFTTDVQEIQVTLSVHPELQEGDCFQLTLNGKPYRSTQTATTFTVSRLDRGAYQLQAFVYPKTMKGKPKGQSAVVTIHQIRNFIRQ